MEQAPHQFDHSMGSALSFRPLSLVKSRSADALCRDCSKEAEPRLASESIEPLRCQRKIISPIPFSYD